MLPESSRYFRGNYNFVGKDRMGMDISPARSRYYKCSCNVVVVRGHSPACSRYFKGNYNDRPWMTGMLAPADSRYYKGSYNRHKKQEGSRHPAGSRYFEGNYNEARSRMWFRMPAGSRYFKGSYNQYAKITIAPVLHVAGILKVVTTCLF